MTDRTNADAVAELALRGGVAPQIIKAASGREFLILPAAGGGATFEDVSEDGQQLSVAPDWIDQAVTVQTAESLIEYVNRFSNDQTVLFADIDHNRIVAVLDYHDVEDAKRLAHKATLDLPFSVEWKSWTEIDGKLMGQLEFARFLEENSADIEAPQAAELIEMCRDLQARRNVNFTKQVRTSSDNENFEYSEETKLGTKKGEVEIPSKFLLRLPIYFGGQSYQFAAFLRTRLVEGEGLKLGIKIHNREHVRQTVFKDVVLEASEKTDRPAYFGRI